MQTLELHNRIIANKDWATLFFLVCVVIIALNKNSSAQKFKEFISLFSSDKYNKMNKDTTKTTNVFLISMFVIQLITVSFFIFLVFNQFKAVEKSNFIIFIQIITFVTVFILGKYLIDKIIATTFDIEEFSEQFSLLKVNYRSYFAFLLFPVMVFMYYNSFDYSVLIWAIFIVLATLNTATYFSAIEMYQNLIKRKLFYFILYLCTLEIAPYYFMYNWFLKN
jgi:hypothetical protein